MAKGSNDLILRDRLQFETTTGGSVSLVYGRIDFSDYVSIPEAKGLAIKEIRFQFRTPNSNQVFPIWMNAEDSTAFPPQAGSQSSLVAFATTTAYENAPDIGIASPNVIAYHEMQSVVQVSGGSTAFTTFDYQETRYGTPDLHPEGYDVVTDLLIGVHGTNLQNPLIVDETLELDVMIIAEPKKITNKDLTQMLSQAQDL